MGVLSNYLSHRLAELVDHRKVLVWYDPHRYWEPWVCRAIGRPSLPQQAERIEATLEGQGLTVLPFAGSYYELVFLAEPLISGDVPERLLVYVGGELPPERLSPLRELECLGGEKERFMPGLQEVARTAFQRAGLAEAKIDELVDRPNLSFELLDQVSIGDDGGASPLQPIFGSSREVDVVPDFLADAARRHKAAEAGLLDQVALLAEQGLGLKLKDEKVADESLQAQAERLAKQITRALLIAEMRSDLSGPEPKEISQIPRPNEVQLARAREACRMLRLLHPAAYAALADQVEKDFGLATAEIDPLSLGAIDTFRFEERRLLAGCNALLAAGEDEQALTIVQQRSMSYWTSIERYPERHAAWDACGELAQLSIEISRVEQMLKSLPTSPKAWVEAYAHPESGWQLMDRRFRAARHRLASLSAESELEKGAAAIFARYEGVLERMAEGFSKVFGDMGWQVEGIARQTEVFSRFVGKGTGPVAYFLVDAMRFEMGVALAEQLESAGAKDMSVSPAIAAIPTITDVGMVALLPGAERSFTLGESGKGISGVIDGKALRTASERMDWAKAEIPGLAEMTLDRLIAINELPTKKLQDEIKGAPVVIIRSTEIDGAGENLPDAAARVVMDTMLEQLRKGIMRLSDAGVSRFVITADHGHLFGSRKGDEMKIDPPSGGQMVDLHRRCWVGRGGDTPSSCMRATPGLLGYSKIDLDVVVSKGLGVFKAGGSLAYHHGGVTLQELVVPVVSFSLGMRPSAGTGDVLAFEQVPKEITNLIFSVALRRTDLPMEPMVVRVIAEAPGPEGPRIVGQAMFSTQGWDPTARTVSLEDGNTISVGLQIEDEDVSELRVLVLDADTERTLMDTQPLPVRITR